MPIIAINGRLRSGKGVFMTMLCLALSIKGSKILANYTIKDPNCQKIDFYDLLELLQKGRQLEQKVIAIDEIQGWLDSRVSQSKSNRFGTYFLFQSAKLGYDLIYSAQVNMRADIDFRYLADVRILANKDLKNKRFIYQILDPNFPDRNVPSGKNIIITFEQARKWWDLYNTFEAVAPVGLEEMLADIEKFNPERLNNRVQEYALAVLEYLGSRPLSVYSVKNAMLRKRLPSALASFVYGRAIELKQQKVSATIKSQSPFGIKKH